MLKTISSIISLLDKKARANTVLLFFLICFYSITSIYPVFLIEKIVDSININNINQSILNILLFGISYLIVHFFAQWFYALSNLIAEKLEIDFGIDLQLKFFKNSIAYCSLNNDNSGSIANKLIEDTKYISTHSFSCISIFFRSIFTFIIGLLFMLNINIALTIIIFPLGILVSFASKKIESKMEILLENQRQSNEFLWRYFSDGIRGAKTLFLYDQSNTYYTKIRKTTSNLKEISYNFSKVNNFGSCIINSLYMFAIGIILIFSAIFVTKGWISYGGLTALIMYNHMLIDPLIDFFECRKKIINVKISLQRLNPILRSANIERKITNLPITEIQLNSVSFFYNQEKMVLNNITYSFKSGQKYVIFGQSGSGKTTLIMLLASFLKPKKGSIAYFSNDTLVNSNPDISYLMQDDFLFDDTIRNNVKISNPEINDDTLECIIEDCLLKNVEKSLDYKSIGENGCKISGGERKRVQLAQALARTSASIIIFDELSSSLDSKSFDIIMSNIQKYLANKICIFIEHNTSYDYRNFTRLTIHDGKLYYD